jgi:hypothetical protein
MKVLVADKFEQSGQDGLKSLGCEVIYKPDIKDDSLTQTIRDERPEVLVVRSTKVNEAMLDAGTLALVVRAGALTRLTWRRPRSAAFTFQTVPAKLRRRRRTRLCADARA